MKPLPANLHFSRALAAHSKYSIERSPRDRSSFDSALKPSSADGLKINLQVSPEQAKQPRGASKPNGRASRHLGEKCGLNGRELSEVLNVLGELSTDSVS